VDPAGDPRGLLPLEAGRSLDEPRLYSVLRLLGLSLLLLSISRSKQGKYLLFLYPFVGAVLALLVSRLRVADDEAARRARRIVRGVLAFVAAVLAAAALALYRSRRGKSPPMPGSSLDRRAARLGAVAALVLLAAASRDRAGGLRPGGRSVARGGRARAKGLPAMNERKTAARFT